MVFSYPQDIVGEFPLEFKNDDDDDNDNNNNNSNNNNNNNNNDDKIKNLPYWRSCQQIKFFVSAEVCNF